MSNDDDEGQRPKRPGLVEDRRGGLVGGEPQATGLVSVDGHDGPDTLRDGSHQGRSGPPGAASSQLRQLLLDPNEIAAMNVALTAGRHRRTLELLELGMRRVDLHRGVLEPAAIHQALKTAFDLLAQLQQANKAHLKHEHLKRNASAFAAWLDALRRVQDRVTRDALEGAAAFRTFVMEEERKADDLEAQDAVRTIAKVGISGELWQNLILSFGDRVSADRLLELAREQPQLGPKWRPPANRAEVDALLQCIKWIQADESYRLFSLEPPAVTERDLLKSQVQDVGERAAHVIARFASAELGSPELSAIRTADAKVTSWLQIMAIVARENVQDSVARVSKVIWMERARRFRRDMLGHIKKKYANDARIDFGEWISLKDRAEEVIDADKDGALEALIMLCREVTKDPNWTPPKDPGLEVHVERQKREQAEQRATQLQHAQMEGSLEAARQLHAKLAQKEQEHARARAEHEQHVEKRVEQRVEQRAEQRAEADRASQIITEMTKRPPRLFVGAGVGALVATAVLLLVGAVTGQAFSSTSRMSLAVARSPLTSEAPPDRLRVACAPKAARDARVQEDARGVAQAIGSVHPPSAAASASARGATCSSSPSPSSSSPPPPPSQKKEP